LSDGLEKKVWAGNARNLKWMRMRWGLEREEVIRGKELGE